MQIKLKPVSAKKNNLKLLSKGQQENKERKNFLEPNFFKSHLSFDKHNDIMLLHNI